MIVVCGHEAALSSLRSLRVVLPSGDGYWTVVDENYRVVEAADGFLRDLRLARIARSRRRSSTPASWRCSSDGRLADRGPERAARELSRFDVATELGPGCGFGPTSCAANAKARAPRSSS